MASLITDSGDSQSFVDGTLPSVPELSSNIESQKTFEKRVQNLFGDSLVKFMLAADFVLGILLALVIGIKTNEDRCAWQQIKKGKAKIAILLDSRRQMEAYIEIAKGQFLKGVLLGRRKYERRQHTPYFQAIPVAIALLSISPTVHAQSDTKRMEAVLLDVSGSVAKKTGASELYQEYLASARKLLQTEPPQSRVWIFLISTESFGSIQSIVKGWTPSVQGVFQDRLNQARRQLVDAFETKSASLSPVASGTDIIGGLWRIKAAFESVGTKRVAREVHILSDMMNESQDFPMPALVPTGTEKMIEHVRQHGLLVHMQGYRIYIYGASTMGMTPQTWNIVKEFWQRYFQEAGADLMVYSAEPSVERR